MAQVVQVLEQLRALHSSAVGIGLRAWVGSRLSFRCKAQDRIRAD